VHDHAAYYFLHPCIVFMLVSHTYIFAIDHAEQAPEEPPEPAQVKGVNIEQDQC
jgi:hypothetical protein